MKKKYTDINAKTIDAWVAEGWQWGKPIDHETFKMAQQNNWDVLLTPTKAVPRDWFCSFKGSNQIWQSLFPLQITPSI